MKKPVEIILRKENPCDAPECESGVVRIESVEIIYEDGTSDSDNELSFNLSYHEENAASYNDMINTVKNKYPNVPISLE